MFVVKENTLNESDSQAEYLCRQALADAGFAFGNPPATFHWSQLINPAGDKQAAVQAYESLLHEEPENKSALEGLAYIYQVMGFQDKAQVYRKKLRQVELKEMGINANESPECLSYVLAKTGESSQPDRVPNEYVSAHFDQYADTFELHLCEKLAYQGHMLLKAEMQSLALDARHTNVLDIGCGTGLTGEVIEALCTKIDGVDLSEKMLAQAASKNIYASLKKQDYLEYLNECQEKYQVITASDVLVYVGDLRDSFNAVKKALSKNGYFIFSVEKAEKDAYCLRNTGRFQHSASYIEQLAEECGFDIVNRLEVVLRINAGQDVDSFVFTLKRND